VLQISSRSSYYGAGGETNLNNNAYYNAGWKYVTTGGAGIYSLDSNSHKWYTAASGTAGNAITFTQAMTLDASSNLQLGTTTAKTTTWSGSGNGMTIGGASAPGLAVWDTSDASYIGYIYQANADTAIGNNATGNLTFATGNTERARIDSSGNLLVNCTSAFRSRVGQIAVIGSSQEALATKANDLTYSHWVAISADAGAGTHYLGYFENSSGANVGSISHNNTTTSYTTSSDYRLKNSIAPMTGALAKVALLKPCTYKWNADGSDGEGFIAHELAEIVPQCVTGEKDAVDADGNPKYQGIDTSFLVATVVAALQELKAEFDAYKASHP